MDDFDRWFDLLVSYATSEGLSIDYEEKDSYKEYFDDGDAISDVVSQLLERGDG